VTPERWERVKALFADATARSSEGRLEFVHRAAAGDDELRDEVLSLLRASEGTDSLPGARAAIAASLGGHPSSDLRATLESALGQHYEIVSSIGPKVKELRREQRLSLQQLAVKAEVSAAAIHKIERNDMVPTITTLLKVATALGRPVSYFVQEADGQPEPVAFTSSTERPTLFTPHAGLTLAGVSGPYAPFRSAAALATRSVQDDARRSIVNFRRSSASHASSTLSETVRFGNSRVI